MSGTHEPRREFVDRLEARIVSEASQQAQAPPARSWWYASPVRTALAAAILAVVSMGLGGAAVGAAWQAETNQRRDVLVGTRELDLGVARERLALAQQQLDRAQQRARLGLDRSERVAEAELKVTEAQVEVETLELNLAEIRLTGREPLDDVAAPLVSGRDFVGERWRVARRLPEAALALARRRHEAAQRRYDYGMTTASEVMAAQAELAELEPAVEAFNRRIALRARFLEGVDDATLARFRVMEAEVLQASATATRQIELTRKLLDDINVRIEIGTLAPLESAEVRAELLQLEADLAKAELELALIRARIKEHRDDDTGRT